MISLHSYFLLGAVAMICSQSLAAQAPDASYAISGLVTDAAGTPLPGVEVMLVSDNAAAAATALTRSGVDGSFAFERLTAGPFYMRVRRLGFRLLVVQIRPDTLAARKPFRVALQTAPVELESVEVEARSTQAMKDFDERRRKRGTGRFIDRAEIERRRPAYTSDLLHNYPGMSVKPGRIGNAVRVRGCRPSVWIDGVQAQGAEIDDVTRPSDIAGIEVYSAWSGVPPQFADRGGRNCGAILVWTRIN